MKDKEVIFLTDLEDIKMVNPAAVHPQSSVQSRNVVVSKET